MHVENGFWELVDKLPNIGFDIFRVASIPHGDSLVAMGTSSVINGPPIFDLSLSGEPMGDLPAVNGYLDPFGFPYKYPDFRPDEPNLTLSNYLDKQIAAGLKVTKTVELKVSTQNRGGINNIASLQTNAKATQFDATFWIETLEDSQGKVTQQLQYSQRFLIEFPIQNITNGVKATNLPGQTIVWPHINVNTLTLTA
jgi:hypothetical protein